MCTSVMMWKRSVCRRQGVDVNPAARVILKIGLVTYVDYLQNGKLHRTIAVKVCGGSHCGTLYALQLGNQWRSEVVIRVCELIDNMKHENLGHVIAVFTDYSEVFLNFEFRHSMGQKGVECMYSRYCPFQDKQDLMAAMRLVIHESNPMDLF